MRTIKTTWNKRTGKQVTELPLELVKVQNFHGEKKTIGFASPYLLSLVQKLQEAYNEGKKDKDCLFFNRSMRLKIKGELKAR